MRIQFCFGFLCGAAFLAGLHGLFEDSFGSLQKYCAYLQEDGHWIQGPVATTICICTMVNVVAGGLCGLIFFPPMLEQIRTDKTQ
jgi:hypothetical protein